MTNRGIAHLWVSCPKLKHFVIHFDVTITMETSLYNHCPQGDELKLSLSLEYHLPSEIKLQQLNDGATLTLFTR